MGFAVAEDQEFTLPPLEERPLVTFALFAYNQERYIREAVEGAFAQTYEPLEIILSDDCSTDRTYEIIEELAAKYEGPHKLIVRRSTKNRGLGLHIYDVTNLATGSIIVVAAGDDISLPMRSQTLVALMETEGTQFAASCYNKMNDDGTIIEQNVRDDYAGHYVWQLINADPSFFAGGATAAYRLNFVRKALDSAIDVLNSGTFYYEDILFAAYAVAIDTKPSFYENSALVNYRINNSSLTNFRRIDKTLADEMALLERERFRSLTRLAVIKAILEISTHYPNLAQLLNERLIFSEKRLSELELDASDENFRTRLRTMTTLKNSNELKISFARIFGLKALALMRFAKKHIFCS